MAWTDLLRGRRTFRSGRRLRAFPWHPNNQQHLRPCHIDAAHSVSLNGECVRVPHPDKNPITALAIPCGIHRRTRPRSLPPAHGSAMFSNVTVGATPSTTPHISLTNPTSRRTSAGSFQQAPTTQHFSGSSGKYGRAPAGPQGGRPAGHVDRLLRLSPAHRGCDRLKHAPIHDVRSGDMV